MLEERIRREGAPLINSQDRLLVATLMRMGASEEEIIQTLAFDDKKETRMRFAFRAAKGPRACE